MGYDGGMAGTLFCGTTDLSRNPTDLGSEKPFRTEYIIIIY